ncbi:MAG: DUF2156 domain-containing protein [Desulfovibrio sp.]|uniref:DUF2156 domain-containing protein n=1 Tax=Desulfovibrio sp. 7SRBS1 TaxID=3378064 RepID=UPI003B3E14D0
MLLDFTPVTLDRQTEYRTLFDNCRQKASDYSYINLWGWRDEYGLEWAWTEDRVWLRQTKPETVYWAPIGRCCKGKWNRDMFPDDATRFIRVPEALAQIWTDELGLELTEDRGHFDYIYSVPELVELSGNKFHKKKNLLNQFKKKYDYEFKPMTPDCVEQALDMQDSWCRWRDCESSETLLAENEAIYRVLTHWDRLDGLIGGAIWVDGRIVAYSLADALEGDTLVIHFEKGETKYKGIYQAINQMFLENQGGTYLSVNREQDLGDEGLRKAKLSYNPTGFLKKYALDLK